MLDYRIWSPKSHPLAGGIQGKFGHAVGAILRCSSRSLRRPGKPHLRGNDTAVGTEGIVSPLLTRHPSSLATLRQRLSSPRPRWRPGFLSPRGSYRSKRRIRCGGMHAVLEGSLGDLLRDLLGDLPGDSPEDLPRSFLGGSLGASLAGQARWTAYFLGPIDRHCRTCRGRGRSN